MGKLIKMSQIARIAISRSCLSGWQRPAVVLSQQTSRALTTTTANKDIDSAAKFIGAGAATVGVAGSGAGIGSVFVPSSLAMPVTHPLNNSFSPTLFWDSHC